MLADLFFITATTIGIIQIERQTVVFTAIRWTSLLAQSSWNRFLLWFKNLLLDLWIYGLQEGNNKIDLHFNLFRLIRGPLLRFIIKTANSTYLVKILIIDINRILWTLINGWRFLSAILRHFQTLSQHFVTLNYRLCRN